MQDIIFIFHVSMIRRGAWKKGGAKGKKTGEECGEWRWEWEREKGVVRGGGGGWINPAYTLIVQNPNTRASSSTTFSSSSSFSSITDEKEKIRKKNRMNQ